MNPLTTIENFITIVEQGSITAAADKLEITPAAVSKRLQLLEQNLGTRLLTRNTRQIALTEAGEYYYHHNKSLLAEMERIDEHVQGMQRVLKGNLKLNLPMTYGKKRLTHLLVDFLKLHPDITINSSLDDAIIDVNRGEYDLVIRIGDLEDSDLVARKLEDISLLVVASPDYLAKHGTPQHPDDLKDHNCLNYTNSEQREFWRFYNPQGEIIRIKTRGSLSCNNGEALKIASLQGLGISMMPDFALQPELEQGTLVRLLTAYQTQRISAYAVYPSRQYLPEKTRALIHFLITNLNANSLH